MTATATTQGLNFGKLVQVVGPVIDVEFPSGKLPAIDRKSTRLNSSHIQKSRMPSSA